MKFISLDYKYYAELGDDKKAFYIKTIGTLAHELFLNSVKNLPIHPLPGEPYAPEVQMYSDILSTLSRIAREEDDESLKKSANQLVSVLSLNLNFIKRRESLTREKFSSEHGEQYITFVDEEGDISMRYPRKKIHPEELASQN